jgi:hypothetical protein
MAAAGAGAVPEDDGFEVNQHVPVLAVGPELDNHIARRLNFGNEPAGNQPAGNGGIPPPGGEPVAAPNINIGVIGNNPAGAAANANQGAAAHPPGNEPMNGGKSRKRRRKSHRKSRKNRKGHRRRN